MFIFWIYAAINIGIRSLVFYFSCINFASNYIINWLHLAFEDTLKCVAKDKIFMMEKNREEVEKTEHGHKYVKESIKIIKISK